MDHARKLKFSVFVYLPSLNKMFQNGLRLSDSVHVEEILIFEHECYIPALGHIRMLILSIYVLIRQSCTQSVNNVTLE